MSSAPSSSFTRISFDVRGNAAFITLKNPPVNVIDLQMMDELRAAIEHAEQLPDVNAFVCRGEGSGFSAGVDIAAHTPEHIQEMLTKFHAVILAIARSNKISIAAVHGNCLGGGAEIALVCDIVYSTTDATWGFPEIKLACFPPVACVALGAIVGQKRAAELIVTGRSFTGIDAAKMHLATETADSEHDMDHILRGTLLQLRDLSASALALTKKAIYTWDGLHLDKGLARAEKIYLEELMNTDDVREGVDAWREKRKPKWKNS